MRLKQYIYFALWSYELSTVAIEERVGLKADQGRVRGSKSVEQDVPRSHSWEIHAQLPSERVDQQVEDVLSRIAPHEAAIAGLISELGDRGGGVLEIVRYFNDPEEDERAEEGLGFAVEERWLQLLARLGAAIDVDEYDSSASYG